MTTYSQSFDFSLVNCSVCSIPYGVLASMAGKKGLTCPNGHSGTQPPVSTEPQIYGGFKPDLTPIRSTGAVVGHIGLTATRLAQPEHQPQGPQTRPTAVSELRAVKPPLKGRPLAIWEYLQEHPDATSADLAVAFECTVAQAAASTAYITRWSNMTVEQLNAQTLKLRDMRKAQAEVAPERFVRTSLADYITAHPDQEFSRKDISDRFGITMNHASATLSILTSQGVIKRIRAGVFGTP